MKKKELLFVTHHLTVGGVQKSLISALSAIDYDKYNVTLYVRKNRLDILDYIDKRVNVVVNQISRHYYRLPSAIKMSFQIKLFGIFKKKQKREIIKRKLSDYISQQMMIDEQKRYYNDKKFDIAIAYVQSITALFVAKYVNAEKKIVFYQGSTDEWHDVNAEALPHFDRIAVEHDDIKQLMLQWYERLTVDQFYIIENYTDYKLLRKQSHEYVVKTFENIPTLCTCSRFTLVKGVDIAVEAARILKQKEVKFIWYLVGDGSEKANLQQLIEKYGLEEHVLFPGMQKNPYPYMAACDIYVQPSREEALSIAMLESQILCAPMVSTKTAGGVAMIQDEVNGLLAEITAESLAEKIELLINDDKLRATIRSNLSMIDYSAEEKRYKRDWEELLS